MFDLNQAIKQQSFHEHNVPVVKKGDTSLDFENSVTITGKVFSPDIFISIRKFKYLWTGTATSNPQTHWYLEPLCSVAEIIDNRIEMQLTTQFQLGS